jgi:hypothetical protein
MAVVGYVAKSKKHERWVYEADGEFWSCLVDAGLDRGGLEQAIVKAHQEAKNQLCGEAWIALAKAHGTGFGEEV